jgi:hypothetical protein
MSRKVKGEHSTFHALCFFGGILESEDAAVYLCSREGYGLAGLCRYEPGKLLLAGFELIGDVRESIRPFVRLKLTGLLKCG